MDLAGCGYFVDQCFKDIAVGPVHPSYGMNFTARNDALPTPLSDAPFNILNGFHPHFDRSVGVNVPTFYLGGRMAFTEMHIQDGCLDSVNLIHWGEEGATKLWMFVAPSCNAKFTALLREKLAELRSGGERVPHRRGCAAPYHHKNIVLAPELLRAHDIYFEVVTQRPGTVVYVREGVLHQVINTGINLAEAVNVGGGGWNHQIHAFQPCGCKAAAVVAIPPNSRSYQIITSHSARFLKCPEPGCWHIAPTRAHLNQHARAHERGEANPLLTCIICRSVFLGEALLLRHVREKHPDGASQKWKCPGCHRLYHTKHMARHKRSCAAMAASPAP